MIEHDIMQRQKNQVLNSTLSPEWNGKMAELFGKSGGLYAVKTASSVKQQRAQNDRKIMSIKSDIKPKKEPQPSCIVEAQKAEQINFNEAMQLSINKKAEVKQRKRARQQNANSSLHIPVINMSDSNAAFIQSYQNDRGKLIATQLHQKSISGPAAQFSLPQTSNSNYGGMTTAASGKHT